MQLAILIPLALLGWVLLSVPVGLACGRALSRTGGAYPAPAVPVEPRGAGRENERAAPMADAV
jgi:hypothetical protein